MLYSVYTIQWHGDASEPVPFSGGYLSAINHLSGQVDVPSRYFPQPFDLQSNELTIARYMLGQYYNVHRVANWGDRIVAEVSAPKISAPDEKKLPAAVVRSR